MKYAVILFLGVLISACGDPSGSERDVSVNKAQELLRENPEIVILDVRTPDEYQAGHMENAILINYYDENFDQRISELSRDKTYLVYCHSGNRSGKALREMEEMGFTSVYNLEGGMSEWKSEGGKVAE